MVETKTLHAISHVVVILLFSVSLLSSFFVYLLQLEYGDSFLEPILTLDTIVLFSITLFSLIYMIYIIRSNYKTNVDNKFYRISAWMNIIFAIGAPILFVSPFILYLYSNFYRIALPLLGLIVISFITFLIGYYKNKIR